METTEQRRKVTTVSLMLISACDICHFCGPLTLTEAVVFAREKQTNKLKLEILTPVFSHAYSMFMG